MTTEPMAKNERICAGCGKRDAVDALVRVVVGPPEADGGHAIGVDASGSAFGRGGHVHGRVECVAKACRGGFARVFKTKVSVTPASIGLMIVETADRRIAGLLGGAKRARQIAVGSDAVREAINEDEAKLVIVAADAAAGADNREVRSAVDAGKAIVWGRKKSSADGANKGLGAILGRDEVAVCAVLHEGVAKAIVGAHGSAREFRSEAWWSPEVR